MLRIIAVFILCSLSASAADIAAGWTHSVAVKDGIVWSWGDNSDGQLGQPDAGRSLLPRPVKGLDNVITVAASRHTLALTSDGKVFAWGRNSSGQLGNGKFGLKEKEMRPVLVSGLSDIVAIAAGWEHSLALSRSGIVYAWGSRSHGQLGDGVCETGKPDAKPSKVSGLQNIVAIAAGGQHSLALSKDGTVYAWGNNWNGQLGGAKSGREGHYASPRPVVGADGKGTLKDVVSIAAGALHSAAAVKDGTVYAWGYNGTGQVPTGERGSFWGTKGRRAVHTPTVAVSGEKNSSFKGVAVSAGYEATYALTSEKTLLSSGWSMYGEQGDGTWGRNRSALGPVINGLEIIWEKPEPGKWQPSLVYRYTDKAHVDKGVKELEVVDAFGEAFIEVKNNPAGGYNKGSISRNADYVEMASELIYPKQSEPGKPVSCRLTRLLFGSNSNDNDFATDVRLRWKNVETGKVVDIPLDLGECVYTGNIPPLNSIVSVVGGMHHALARDHNGDIWAWGHNGFGQLGKGDVADGITAQKITLFSKESRPIPFKAQPARKYELDPPKAKFVNVKEHGAVGDGSAFDQQALQKVIDDCGKQGGGIVWFPPGTYRTGTLELRSGVRLHLNAGAVIMASPNCEHYPERRFISAKDVSNISITGKGVIDALGYFVGARGWRHYCIHMENCKDVLLEGVITLNSGSWTQHYIRCIGLTIKGVTVRSLRPGRNNDGIDLSGCENVLIEGCTVISDDDAIVIKSQKAERKNLNIKAINNVCHTYRGAFKLGTETRGRYDNILCRDLTCYGSKALELYSVDGSETSNIVAENVKAYDALIALNVKLGARLRPHYFAKGVEPKVGYMRDVRIKNLDVEIGNKSWREILLEHNIPDAEWANGKPEAPYDSCISGLPGHIIENVSIENMKVRVPGGETIKLKESEIPEKPDVYPHGGNFGTLPAYGLFVRHAKDVKIRNAVFETDKPDVRPAITSFDAEGLVVE